MSLPASLLWNNFASSNLCPVFLYGRAMADVKQRAVVKESLRLSYGTPGRLPRVVPPTGATLSAQFIPPGVSHGSPIELFVLIDFP